MNIRIHRAFHPDTPAVRARLLAEKFYRKVQIAGARQMRLWRGMLRTYPYPAPVGYGTRGAFLGIYTIDTRLEWIVDDVFLALSDSASVDSCEGACIMRLAEVISTTGLSRASIYERIKDGTFPDSVPVRAREVGWKREDIEAWFARGGRPYFRKKMLIAMEK